MIAANGIKLVQLLSILRERSDPTGDGPLLWERNTMCDEPFGIPNTLVMPDVKTESIYSCTLICNTLPR